MSSLFEKIKEMVAEQLDVSPDEIKPESSFVDDLGADSLDITELVMAMEDEFGIEIDDEEAKKLRTVQDVVNFIESRQKNS